MKIIDVLGITANQLNTKSKVQATLSVSLSKLRSQLFEFLRLFNI